MSGKTSIEWCSRVWNPVTGCTRVSAGCDHCYAFALHDQRHVAWKRGRMPSAAPQYHKPFSEVQLLPDRLREPLSWRKPERIFVNSMGDLFHAAVPDEYIDRVFAVMAIAARHTFMVLTKRPERMADYMTDVWRVENIYAQWYEFSDGPREMHAWPLPNVILGTSIEDQPTADERLPHLRRTPAAVRMVSCEPLLGPLDLTPPERRGTNVNTDDWLHDIDWFIVGGESGPHARPMHPDWARTVRDRCVNRRDMGRPWPLPFFFKQWGAWMPAGHANGTHLLHTDGRLMERASATMDHPYGHTSGTQQDLVDRGHDGWVRMRRVGKGAAGRLLDGRTWDEMPRVGVPA